MTTALAKGWATKWTDQEDQFLRDNYANKGAKWCGIQMPTRSAQSYRDRAHRLGIKLAKKNMTHHKLSSNDELAVVKFYAEGQSAQEIVDRLKLNVCLDVVYDALHRHGVTADTTGTRNRRWTDEEETKIESSYASGVDTIKLARLFETSQSAIWLVLQRRGVDMRPAAFGGGRRLTFTDRKGRNFKMRSTWEVGMASWLDDRRQNWDYELETFKVALDGKTRRYTPDFWIYESGQTLLVDVKGAENADQMRKIEALKLQRPELRLEIWNYWELKKRGILPGCQVDVHAGNLNQKENCHGQSY